MRLYLAVALLVLVAGCQTEPAVAPPPAPVKATKPAPVVRYIQASSLKLRAGPSSKAKVRGRLAINSPLEVLEDAREGDVNFARVRVRNGKEGWVGSDFLADQPVTVADARERAANSVAPDVRLSWLQRAAALEPTNLEVLKELQEAYALHEKKRPAQMVGKLITKLKGVEAASKGRLIAAYRDGLEWKELSDGNVAPGDIPKAKWAELGVVDDAELWVLPPTGPAKRVHPKGLKREVWNECGGSAGVTVDVGGKYALAHLGPPPASWSLAPIPWSDDDLTALKTKAQQAHCIEGWDCHVFAVAAKGHGAFARVLNQRDDPEDDMFEFAVVDVRATGPGAKLQKVGGLKTGGYILGEPMPIALRDVVGDDAPEVILQDDCNSLVRTISGEVLFRSSFRCCGC